VATVIGLLWLSNPPKITLLSTTQGMLQYSYRLNGLLSVYHGWLDRAVGDATIDASSRRPKDRVARLRYTARRASVTVYDSVAVLQREKATVLRQSMK